MRVEGGWDGEKRIEGGRNKRGEGNDGKVELPKEVKGEESFGLKRRANGTQSMDKELPCFFLILAA